MTEMPAGADGGPEIDRYYSSGRTGPGRGLAGMAIGGGFERRMCRYPDIRPYLWGWADLGGGFYSFWDLSLGGQT